MIRAVVILVLGLTSAAVALEAPAGSDRWPSVTGPRFTLHVQSKTHAPARLLEHLDRFWTALARMLEVESGPPMPTQVYVFAGRAPFEDYLKSVGQPGNVEGWCRCTDHERVIVTHQSADDPQAVSRRLQHEATHLFLFTRFTDGRRLPFWLVEGLAVYAGHAWVDTQGSLSPAIPSGRLSLVKAEIRVGRAQSMETFLRRPAEEHDIPAGSAQAWSLVWYLRHGRGTEDVTRLNTYLRSTGPTAGVELFEETFRVKVGTFERDWKDYVLNLQP